MNDHDLLEVIADDAPQPGPHHADTVVRAGRVARRRRRAVAMVTGAVGTAAVVIVATVALHESAGEDQHAIRPAKSPVVQHEPAASARATAYAAAIRTIARADDGPAPRVLYVLDHTCANVITQKPGGCHARALPPALRSDLQHALAGFAPVRFIADGATVTGSAQDGLTVRNHGAVVTLGPAEVHARSATVPLSVRRGGFDGRGSTYRLSRAGSGWKVTGTTGAGWIS